MAIRRPLEFRSRQMEPPSSGVHGPPHSPADAAAASGAHPRPTHRPQCQWLPHPRHPPAVALAPRLAVRVAGTRPPHPPAAVSVAHAPAPPTGHRACATPGSDRGWHTAAPPTGRHPGESRGPRLDAGPMSQQCPSIDDGSDSSMLLDPSEHWIPAYAGMTTVTGAALCTPRAALIFG